MADVRTITSGALTVLAAFPDPPFEVHQDGVDTGFDMQLMEAICKQVGLEMRLVKYAGDDFNGIFDGLNDGTCDAIISGTTITPDREKVARFTREYYESGQSLAVNKQRTPEITSTEHLHGQTVGIQRGNTSDIVARKLAADGKIAGVQYYPYHGIGDALDDLEAGKIGGIIKLLPVLTWLVKDRPDLEVVEEIPTHERLGIAVARDNDALHAALDRALADLRADGTVERLEREWLRP